MKFDLEQYQRGADLAFRRWDDELARLNSFLADCQTTGRIPPGVAAEFAPLLAEVSAAGRVLLFVRGANLG